MVDLMHEELVFELPYGPEGMRGPHNKKSFAGMQDSVFGMFENFSIGVTELHPGLDPNGLVAEYASKCTVKATGGPYENRYVGILSFKDGKVVGWKESTTPRSQRGRCRSSARLLTPKLLALSSGN